MSRNSEYCKKWLRKKKTTDPNYFVGKRRRAKESCKRKREEKRNYVLEYLKTHPCIDCGEADPVVLDFDHRKGKTIEVSKLIIQSYSLKRVIKEIEKCEVRCANCHRRRHAKERQWIS